MVCTGLEVLKKEGFKRLMGYKVAILSNQASVDINFKHILDLALETGVNITKLFAPEHGFFGILQDMEQDKFIVHPKLKIPIISLYGDHKDSLKLRSEQLNDVDILLCDLQDIGSRYYTFHCTIAWAMKACLERGVKLMLIDRPNPINAHDVEGNLVKESNFSFVGAYPLANRHGFTMGELVKYVSDILEVNFPLEIVLMSDYDRTLYQDELKLKFVPPSPNMPTLDTALVYPGLCLIEGTNLSEGRGTTTPFEIVGASYIKDKDEFKKKIDAYEIPGAILRAINFKPMFNKHAQKECGGVFIHVVDKKVFKPLRLALAIIKVAMTYEEFDWRREPYEYEHDRLAIDLLLGDSKIRTMLEKDAPLKEIFSILEEEENLFKLSRQKYLLY